MIPFNVPPVTGKEINYINEAIKSGKICGDGTFTKKCTEYLENYLETKVLLTTSCTSSLEMSALLCNIKPLDEVILPSYTFCSTADAFVQRGAKLVFVDIRKDTLNIDETKIEHAITEKTKAIICVHYAGVSCEMDEIIKIAKKYNLKVVEDAAQAIFSTYKGRKLGTIGDFGCFSFHETKNLSMGEGGGISINTNHADYEKAEIIREKGTDRSKFIRGQIDKYTWRDYGSSYLPSDLNAAYLYAQLTESNKIQQNRMNIWNKYKSSLKILEENNKITLPVIPEECKHNAHIFYFITKSLEERTKLISFLKQNEIQSVFHYIPLHSSPAGIKFGRFDGKDEITTEYSERLIRLPLYYGLKDEDQNKVIENVLKFYGE
ncbi:MAG: dTDP-4-amino-4,6-dideoxygalactose transaminase [Spirochaetia bacterium]|nr:dTDP-4-amino-4,6-dideoxygalactose transaminase [Spirochaetia bacterium]MCI7798260.1 dTDP-4-amino-4,6-dideoxygalactose transaminase [Spirochaetia bacterium]MDD6930914.1 dTDP-4-amino-4,6-dideoxygalactose transaminase [Treponema sp.]MDY3886115.1 dTDP-4-amino-4,6-dideoxygalactose transaminase [Treponema sp.]MDY5765208.1 dTDP-4-amino-4,6-dideoxygalactose transaminase [Treponema sp.]